MVRSVRTCGDMMEGCMYATPRREDEGKNRHEGRIATMLALVVSFHPLSKRSNSTVESEKE